MFFYNADVLLKPDIHRSAAAEMAGNQVNTQAIRIRFDLPGNVSVSPLAA